MVTAHGAGFDLQLAPRCPADTRPPRQYMRDRPLAVDADQLRRPSCGRCLSRVGVRTDGRRSQSLDAGLNSSEHIRIIALAALQAADQEFALLERTAGSLQRGPQVAVFPRRVPRKRRSWPRVSSVNRLISGSIDWIGRRASFRCAIRTAISCS